MSLQGPTLCYSQGIDFPKLPLTSEELLDSKEEEEATSFVVTLALVVVVVLLRHPSANTARFASEIHPEAGRIEVHCTNNHLN